jgi:hypothetical protein
MALIKCKECNKEISDNASQCPNCGYVYKKTKNKKEKSSAFKIVIPIIVAIAVFIIGIVLFIVIDKGMEKINEKKILNQVVGTWQYKEVSKVNGGVSYSIITFTENKNFRYTSGFIYGTNSDFKYGYEGTISIYEDGSIWLYTNDNEYIGHFEYNKEYDELYEIDRNDASSKKLYTKK